MKMPASGKRQYSHTGSLNPRKSVFDLSYEKKLSCDMGQLIPVMCDEVVPGDLFKIGNQAVFRFQPLVAPILHEVNVYVHYFFVPYRILWDEWEDFITGGVDGSLAPTPPTWEPTKYTVGSLWDYLGFPATKPYSTMYPLDFPRIAYNRIYNEYYRDETLQTEVAETNEDILHRNWEKDYFTSSLPWQQRGTAPALPISGIINTSAVWPAVDTTGGSANAMYGLTFSKPYNAATKSLLDNNTVAVNLSSATTFNVADLRLAFQVQKWLERNARAGARYTEFLRSHFGVSPRDDRLQRPEYIGGSKNPIIISEVLQTSKTDTSPQGNMAGHGIGIADNYCGKIHVQEYGLIMGIMSIMPRTGYQDGINRQWLRRTKYDFFFPEFANLSEQAVLKGELYIKGDTYDDDVFGYQGRYDEMRTKNNQTCGVFRTTYNYWHLNRIFASPPALNSSFITCDPASLKRIFAATSEPGILCSFANLIKAVRPMPIMAEPGLIDHN